MLSDAAGSESGCRCGWPESPCGLIPHWGAVADPDAFCPAFVPGYPTAPPESGSAADKAPAARGLGWHVIAGEDLLAAFRRVENGEQADLVYAELWANADHEQVEE